ncbi:response regulator [Aquihabitans sp. McL0605]|uniref:response regulator n=1 Tax=Aquihabitans sp. McL0605 TaxID=3415671 RepID=UPI003CF6FCD6
MAVNVVVRVLIVDDQLPFRSAARSVVDRLSGFEVVGEAESGEDAVTMAAELTPHLVLMDINMGAMDGIEATRHLVAQDPAVMVVLLSTYELSDLPPDARTSGASAYVPKDDFGGREIRALWESGGDEGFRRPTGSGR